MLLNHGRYYGFILHARKKSLQRFKIKNLGEYHDLYVESNILLLADVFENVRDMCCGIYKLDPG